MYKTSILHKDLQLQSTVSTFFVDQTRARQKLVRDNINMNSKISSGVRLEDLKSTPTHATNRKTASG